MQTATSLSRLPALRIDSRGRRRVDYRAVFALVLPLFFNQSIQAVLNLTDLWFVGRISPAATAAMGAVFYLVIMFIVFFGGVGWAVQTVAAQAFGGGRKTRAALAAWTGLWGTLLTVPFFIVIALGGDLILSPFGLEPEIQRLAIEYWQPRLFGGPAMIALWAVAGFFNGIGRTRVSLLVMACVAAVNFPLNQLLMFELGLGMAGAGWATGAAQLIGLGIFMVIFLRQDVRLEYRSMLMWRPRPRHVASLVALGVPMGLAATVDLAGFSVFMLMQARLGEVAGAATQIVMQLTSLAFGPAIGIAMAGTTLVGQSIGAGDKDWAIRTGNAIVRLCVIYMGALGVGFAVAGQGAIAPFVGSDHPGRMAVIELGATLLWIAACYQVFDAVNLSSSFCLRGAGDVKFPAVMLFVLSWIGFVPLAHIMTFAPGEGFVSFLPQLGMGSTGGWIAAVIYIVVLSPAMFLRWRLGGWKKFAVLG